MNKHAAQIMNSEEIDTVDEALAHDADWFKYVAIAMSDDAREHNKISPHQYTLADNALQRMMHHFFNALH